ncbi:MAG: GNAT family N-acetyltransferase [Cyanobacteria bacterium P01_D01_bin.56]
MATVSTFRCCTYTGEADFAAIASLINTCREADDLDSRTSVTDVQEDFASPRFDINRDLRLWRDGRGNVVAIAELWHDSQPNETEFLGSVYFDIHPHVRGEGLEETIMAWAEQRLQEASQDKSLPLVLQTGCRDKLTERKNLLQQFGFTPERYFFQLQRSLAEEIVVPSLPAGWIIRTVDAERDAENWVAMFNQSFVDHWNHSPMTVEDFHYYSSFKDHNPELDLVIETAEGKLVTFCYSMIDPEYNQRLERQEGHVCLLGTRRGYRRQGLARTLLAAGLQRLQSRGMATATIGVDAQNPNGAVALYTSVGFTQKFRSTVYRRVLACG